MRVYLCVCKKYTNTYIILKNILRTLRPYAKKNKTNKCDVTNDGDVMGKGDVGRPLVGLQGNIIKNLHYRSGDPQGASLHFQQYPLKTKTIFNIIL
jgi:hypothetical protein